MTAPRTLALALVLLLAGCGEPSAEPDAQAAHSAPIVSAESAAVFLTLSELSPENREAASESLQALVAHCPYTRAALDLPFALHDAVSGIAPAALDPTMRTAWSDLQAGLLAHTEALIGLGVTPGEASLDLAAMADRVASITETASGIDAGTRELIAHHSARVEAATGVVRPCPRGPFSVMPGSSWTLWMQLRDWSDALAAIEPFVVDPDASERVTAMTALLVAHGEVHFATIPD